jgi:hypothetical protein
MSTVMGQSMKRSSTSTTSLCRQLLAHAWVVTAAVARERRYAPATKAGKDPAARLQSPQTRTLVMFLLGLR